MSVDVYKILKSKKDVFTEEEDTIMAAAFERRDNLATKDDLGKPGTDLRKDIQAMETGLKKDIQAMETGLRKDIQAVETGLKRDIWDLRLETSDLRKSIHALDKRTLAFGVAILPAIFIPNPRILDFVGKLWGALPK